MNELPAHRRERYLADGLGADGWVPLDVEIADCLALVRYRTDERGRQRITALMLVGETVDSGTLKRVPIGSISTELNMRDPSGLAMDPSVMKPLVEAAHRALSWHPGDRVAARKPAPRARLARPTGEDPDAFYRLVADAYREVALQRKSVAPVLADEAGVPVPTVHRWIGEARRRGFLPPARKGRAG